MNDSNLKNETLLTAREYMDNLTEGIKASVEMLYGGKETEGFSIMPSICEGIQYIIEVVMITKSQNDNTEYLQILHEKLTEIVEALESNDYILVGDLMNYEVLPLLEEITNYFNEKINDAEKYEAVMQAAVDKR